MLIVILAFLLLASTLVWYLLRHDHGRRLPVGSLWTAFGFGVLAMVLALVVEGLLFPSALFDSPDSFSLHYRLFAALGVGSIEEALKFIPLALFIYKRSYFREHTDGLIYFAICGLTFGLTENIGYTLSFGTSAGVARLILTPFFHAAGTGILGYYLVGEKLNRKARPMFALACLTIPALHGLYDFGLLSNIPILILVSLMITLLLTMGLFLYFMHADELDRANLAHGTAVTPLSLSHVAGHQVYGLAQPTPQVPFINSAAATGHRNGLAIAGFVLGVLGCLAWLLSLIGTAIGILALVFGLKGLHSRHHRLAVTGIVLSLLVIPLSLFATLAYIGYIEEATTKTNGDVSSALFSEPTQSIVTPCYSATIPASLTLSQVAGSCTFTATNSASGEVYEVKVVQTDDLTADNLAADAQDDTQQLLGSIPGSSVSGQHGSNFVGHPAYIVSLTATDGSAGTIDYVYNATAQGNLVIVIHTQRTGRNVGLNTLEQSWAWQ